MVVGTLAIGQTLVILTGGIDLSCGMIMALSSVLMTGLIANSGVHPLLAVLAGLAVCVAFGVLNGWLSTAIGLPPFIVTLGTYNIAFALVRIYTSATITDLPDSLLFFGNTFQVAAPGSPTARCWCWSCSSPPGSCSAHPGRAGRLRGGRQPRGRAPGRHPHQTRAHRRLHRGRRSATASPGCSWWRGPASATRRRASPATSTASPRSCWAAPASSAAAAMIIGHAGGRAHRGRVPQRPAVDGRRRRTTRSSSPASW